MGKIINFITGEIQDSPQETDVDEDVPVNIRSSFMAQAEEMAEHYGVPVKNLLEQLIKDCYSLYQNKNK